MTKTLIVPGLDGSLAPHWQATGTFCRFGEG
jgi:predicted alpha/beta hydrolase family esterase